MISRRNTLLAAGSAIFLASATKSQAGLFDRRVIKPGAPWRDDQGQIINAHGGGILLHDDRFYWFGEHKIEGRAGNTAQVGVHVYSSADLCTWRDGGIALAVSDDPQNEIAKGCILERPKVLFNAKTSKFVMWFHLEFKGQGYKSARAGVATADNPQGPYSFLRSYRPNAGQWPVNVTQADKVAGPENYLERDFADGQMARDMTLFQDDDGKAYLIASSEENRTLHVSQLTDDFTNFSGAWARAIPDGSNEAPALFKHKGRYFMITSGTTGWAPNAARAWVADSLFGAWTSLGNPVRGTDQEMATTFGGQSTFVLPYRGRLIFMADRWAPKNPIDGRYIWLPIDWENEKPTVRWRDHWPL